MPLTPFHVVVVWPIYVRWPRRWDVLALTCGAVMPDLEVVAFHPALQGILSRGILHSLLGVVTLNLALTLVAARVVIPGIAGRLHNRFPDRGWRRFAGRDYVADRKPLAIAVGSGVVGGITHLLIDLPSHDDTPLLWPWHGATFSIGPWASDPFANVVASAITGVIFVWMVAKWVGR